MKSLYWSCIFGTNLLKEVAADKWESEIWTIFVQLSWWYEIKMFFYRYVIITMSVGPTRVGQITIKTLLLKLH